MIQEQAGNEHRNQDREFTSQAELHDQTMPSLHLLQARLVPDRTEPEKNKSINQIRENINLEPRGTSRRHGDGSSYRQTSSIAAKRGHRGVVNLGRGSLERGKAPRIAALRPNRTGKESTRVTTTRMDPGAVPRCRGIGDGRGSSRDKREDFGGGRSERASWCLPRDHRGSSPARRHSGTGARSWGTGIGRRRRLSCGRRGGGWRGQVRKWTAIDGGGARGF